MALSLARARSGASATLLALALGCGGGAASPTDAGALPAVDVGPPTDTGVRRVDAGRVEPDAGPGWSVAMAAAGCATGCAQVASCGWNVCDELSIDCSLGGVFEACVGACATGRTCDDILNGTATHDCLAACNGTLSGVDAGPPMPTCANCAITACNTEVGACQADGPCAQLMFCTSNCRDAACVDGCIAMTPDALATIRPLYACAASMCSICDPLSLAGR
jgi:hypothetical protein